MLDQIKRRAPAFLHKTWWFWGVWLAVGVVVEIGAAYGWGRKTEGDTFSEFWWTIVSKVADGTRPATWVGKTVAAVMSVGAGGFFLWVAVHLATGYV